MRNDSDLQELCQTVKQTAFEIQKFHGPGHLERVEHGLLINFGGAKFEIRKFAISKWLQDL